MRHLLPLFLAWSCAAEVAIDEGAQPIIGGRQVQAGEFPTVVALEYASGDWTCTGTLVHPEWILTAAHCISEDPLEGLRVRLDALDINAGSTEGRAIAVDSAYAHPEFRDEEWDHDIALLKLTEAVTDRQPSPIHRNVLGPGTTVISVGFGDATTSGEGSGILRVLETENTPCEDASDPEVSDERLLCFDARSGSATCYGDSGGPTFVETAAGLEVAGISSGSTTDSCTAGFDLHTLVAAELSFIDMYLPSNNVPPIDDEDSQGETDPDAMTSGGCQTSPGGGLWLFALIGTFTRFRRRRQRIEFQT